MYHVNIFRLLFSLKDEMHRLREAEVIKNFRNMFIFLFVASLVVYGWIGYLGIGSELILQETIHFTPATYESSKFWFLIGRILFGALFALIVLVIPALIYKWLTNIALKKLIVMQFAVLAILLVERIIWIPVTIFGSLDWFVSPLSFGIIASYFTDLSWIIYFFGSITLFQLFIIWFQARFITSLLSESKAVVWVSVFVLHFVMWWVLTLFTFLGPDVLGRWFG